MRGPPRGPAHPDQALGMGILATAIKGRMLSSEAEREAIGWMVTLTGPRRRPCRRSGSTRARISRGSASWAIPWRWPGPPGWRFASRHRGSRSSGPPWTWPAMGMVPGGTFANKRYCEQLGGHCGRGGAGPGGLPGRRPDLRGLLMAVPEDRADGPAPCPGGPRGPSPRGGLCPGRVGGTASSWSPEESAAGGLRGSRDSALELVERGRPRADPPMVNRPGGSDRLGSGRRHPAVPIP